MTMRLILSWPFLFLLALAELCFAAPVFERILGRSPADSDLALRFLAPSRDYWLGTDELGRDIFLRLLEGGQVSLAVGFTAALLSAAIGTLAGIVAGWRGGAADALLMRMADMLLALPVLPLLIILSAVDLQKLGLGAAAAASPALSLYKIIVLVALFGWVGVARLARARTLSLRHADYVRAARALGMGGPAIVWRHVLPNLMNTVIVAATLAAGNIILMESVLSFLGLGIQPPMASWGNMLTGAQDTIWDNPLAGLYPGAMIFATVMAFNLLGDRLQAQLNPREIQRRDGVPQA